MLKWLKKKLRNWILEDDSPPSLQLEVMKNGRVEKAQAAEVIGLCLSCVYRDGAQGLVKESDALNPSHFRKIFKYMSKGRILVWEDGTPYEF